MLVAPTPREQPKGPGEAWSQAYRGSILATWPILVDV